MSGSYQYMLHTLYQGPLEALKSLHIGKVFVHTYMQYF